MIGKSARRAGAAVRGRAAAVPAGRAYAALALGVLCIGFSAIFTKWAGVPGPVSGFYRVAIATVVLAGPVLPRARQIAGRGRGILALTMLAGLFFAGDLSLWNTSLLYTSAANATLLGNTSTLWVSLWSLLVLHELLGGPFWLGTALALGGAALIVGPDLQGLTGGGDLLAVASSVCYAGYLLTTGRVRRTSGTLEFMWLSSAGAAGVLLIFCLATGLPLAGFRLDQYAALVALALVSHVTGWLAINFALGHLRPALTSVSLLGQPVITALLSVPLLGEGLSWAQVAGGALVLAGIALATRRGRPARTAAATGAGEPVS